MALMVLRGIFVVAALFIGGLVAGSLRIGWWIGVLSGGLVSAGIITIEINFKRFSLRSFTAGVIGLILGVMAGYLFDTILRLIPAAAFSSETEWATVRTWITVSGMAVFVYLGIVLGLKGTEQFNLLLPYSRAEHGLAAQNNIIVDTSVIIDGRIADVAETGFVEGTLYIPRFVLRELQTIADSSDPLKRTRGRRGLDVLNRLQKDPHITVKIHETDFPEIDEVDAKLVKLAKMLEAKVFTNDYNLNKVAEFQQLKVLNVNDLANSLRPIILPGESMVVRVVREGKEPGQGVAYLDDGTMVVVNNGKDKIGQKLDVTVTSVLQTSAGRMIFAELR